MNGGLIVSRLVVRERGEGRRCALVNHVGDWVVYATRHELQLKETFFS